MAPLRSTDPLGSPSRRIASVSDPSVSTSALVIASDGITPRAEALAIARELRGAGIDCEVQLEAKKLAKQFQYADKAGIRFVVLYGEDEAARNVVTVKDLRAKEQFEVARDDLAKTLRVEIEQQRAMGGV